MNKVMKTVFASRRVKMSAVLLAMAVFTVAAFTYAWFVTSDDTTVGSADVNVQDVIALEIRDDDGSWKTSLQSNIQSSELYPVTLDGDVFKEAVITREETPSITYADGSQGYKLVVSGFSQLDDPSGMVYIKDFQIRYTLDSPLFLSDESFMTDSAITPAIRVGIYEKSGSGYKLCFTWIPSGGSDFTQAVTSLTAEQPKDMRIIIWLEGSDPACLASNGGVTLNYELKFLVDQ